MQKCMSDYLDAVCAAIRPKALRQAARNELADHLAARREELVRDGWDAEAASREAVTRMGDPAALGRRLSAANQNPKQKIILAGALFMAAATITLLIAWGGGSLSYLLDPGSLIGVTGLTAAYALISCGGKPTWPAMLRAAATGAVYAGVLCAVIGIIVMLHNLSDPASLGPSISVSLVSSFYGLVLSAAARAAGNFLSDFHTQIKHIKF